MVNMLFVKLMKKNYQIVKQIVKSPTRITSRPVSYLVFPHKFHGIVSLMLVYLTINLSTVQKKFIKSKQGVFTSYKFSLF